MSTNSLTSRTNGEVIIPSFWDQFKTALQNDFMGRDATGAPAAGQNCGTAAFPWAKVYTSQLILGTTALDLSQLESSPYKINSGALRSTSNQPDFLRANGAALSFKVKGQATPLSFQCAGVAGTIASDITVTSSAGASDSTQMTGGSVEILASRTYGELGNPTKIVGSSPSSGIQSAVGQYRAFKINHNSGASFEVFLGYVESYNVGSSGNVIISRVQRGYFMDSTGTPWKRSYLYFPDTIEMLKTGWVFVDIDGATVDVTYNEPKYSYDAPSGPTSGDYWFDESTQFWKRYNGSAFVVVSRLPVGIVASNASACIATRSFEFYKLYRDTNTIQVSQIDVTNTTITNSDFNQSISVCGNLMTFKKRLTWSSATDMAASTETYNTTLQNNTQYFFYLSDQGKRVISDIAPQWRPELLGWYHPQNTWRYVFTCSTDGSAHFLASSLVQRKNATAKDDVIGEPKWLSGVTVPTGLIAADGSAISRTAFLDLFIEIGTAFGVGDGSTTFNIPDLRDRNIVGASGTKTLGASGGVASLSLQHNHTVDSLGSTQYAYKGTSASLVAGQPPGVDYPVGGHLHTTQNALASPTSIQNPYSTHTGYIKI